MPAQKAALNTEIEDLLREARRKNYPREEIFIVLGSGVRIARVLGAILSAAANVQQVPARMAMLVAGCRSEKRTRRGRS